MPKKIISEKKDSREAIDAYHNGLMAAIYLIRGCSPENTELQEFLDYNDDSLLEPTEFKKFHEIFATALDKGTKASLYQNYHEDQRKMKIIIRYWTSKVRTRCYLNLICSRLRCKSVEMVEPISLVELEQRYQYSLYKQAMEHQGLEGSILPFRVWLRTPHSKTFYEEFNLLPLY